MSEREEEVEDCKKCGRRIVRRPRGFCHSPSLPESLLSERMFSMWVLGNKISLASGPARQRTEGRTSEGSAHWQANRLVHWLAHYGIPWYGMVWNGMECLTKFDFAQRFLNAKNNWTLCHKNTYTQYTEQNIFFWSSMLCLSPAHSALLDMRTAHTQSALVCVRSPRSPVRRAARIEVCLMEIRQ